jgi:hypothetical protein
MTDTDKTEPKPSPPLTILFVLREYTCQREENTSLATRPILRQSILKFQRRPQKSVWVIASSRLIVFDA